LDDFKNFYDDVIEGYKEGLELDRVDNDGNYGPDNFRWATHLQNTRNSTVAKLTEESAEYIRTCGKSTKELMVQFGMCKSAINRVKNGKTWKKTDTPQ